MAFAGFLAVKDGTFKFYAAAADVYLFKLDGVGPVDNRPSTD